MAYISTKFGVGETVYQHDPAIDAVFRGKVIGVHVASSNASRYGSGDWTVMYEVQFHPRLSTDMVAEDDLTTGPEFPEAMPKAEPEPLPDPAGMLPDVPVLADATLAAVPDLADDAPLE